MIDLGGKNQVVVGIGRIPQDDVVNGRCNHAGIRIEAMHIGQSRIFGNLVKGFQQFSETDVADHLAVPGQKTPSKGRVGGKGEYKNVPGIAGSEGAALERQGVVYRHDVFLCMLWLIGQPVKPPVGSHSPYCAFRRK